MQFSFRPRAARQLALAAGVLSAASFLTSCNKGGEFVKSKSGFEYKIFRKSGGKYEFHELTSADTAGYKSRVGKFLLGHISVRTGKDSVLRSSRTEMMNHAVPLQLQPVRRKGGQEEAWSMLQPGDSAVFRFSADSLLKGQPVPPFLKRSGNVIVMQVAVDKLIDQTAVMGMDAELRQANQQAQQHLQAEQLKKDDVVLQDYLKKNNLTAAKKTASGLYYLITQPGTGPLPVSGQTAAVQYTGMLLNGKVFDASAKHDGGKPFEFQLGQHAAIPGWDEALLLLPKGSKATLLIPSGLAYGPRGAGADIPANSPLRFDIEVTDVKNTPPPPPAPPMPADPRAMAPGAQPAR